MRRQGKIATWKDQQGFGFIAPDDGGEQIFVHIKSFSNRQRRPIGNEIVTYEWILAGLVILLKWPLSGLWVLGLAVGIDLILHGIWWIASSWTTREQQAA